MLYMRKAIIMLKVYTFMRQCQLKKFNIWSSTKQYELFIAVGINM